MQASQTRSSAASNLNSAPPTRRGQRRDRRSGSAGMKSDYPQAHIPGAEASPLGIRNTASVDASGRRTCQSSKNVRCTPAFLLSGEQGKATSGSHPCGSFRQPGSIPCFARSSRSSFSVPPLRCTSRLAEAAAISKRTTAPRKAESRSRWRRGRCQQC